MSETPDDLAREAEEDRIEKLNLFCALCKEHITNSADLESFNKNNKHCSRCANRMASE